MATPFHKFLNSKLFSFKVGDDLKPIVVHAAAVACQSPVLNRLINGPMQEAQQGYAEMKDVDEDTFVRFCQYAYSGDYDNPSAEIVNKDINGGEESLAMSDGDGPEAAVEAVQYAYEADPPETEDTWNGFGRKIQKQGKKSSKFHDKVKQRFHNLPYDPPQSQRTFQARCTPISNNNLNEDFTPVLLGHARVYHFADKYLIPDLSTLALSKLYTIFDTFTLHPDRVHDVCELIVYAYENTCDTVDAFGQGGGGGGEDELRSLVTNYAVKEFEKLTDEKRFLDLLKDGGDFVGDFVGMVKETVV